MVQSTTLRGPASSESQEEAKAPAPSLALYYWRGHWEMAAGVKLLSCNLAVDLIKSTGGLPGASG